MLEVSSNTFLYAIVVVNLLVMYITPIGFYYSVVFTIKRKQCMKFVNKKYLCLWKKTAK